MLFKDIDIAETILDELRPNELAGVVPELAVGSKDTYIHR